MPDAGHSSIFFGRFPNLRELTTPAPSRNGSHVAPRRIVFFGTPFLLVRNLPVEVYTAQLARCLDAIRRWYPDYEKIYRPHPAETTESTLLDLPSLGFHCESGGLAAELYLLENLAEIDAVFSVGSTVSRTALQLGLNAYALWRLFPFQPAQREFFAGLMGDTPTEFELTDLSRPPRPFAEPRASNINAAHPSFAEALRGAADSVLSGVPSAYS